MPTGRLVSSEQRLRDDASGIWLPRWIIGRGAIGGPKSGSTRSFRSRSASSSGERLENNSLAIGPPSAKQPKDLKQHLASFLEDAPNLIWRGPKGRQKSRPPLPLPPSAGPQITHPP